MVWFRDTYWVDSLARHSVSSGQLRRSALDGFVGNGRIADAEFVDQANVNGQSTAIHHPETKLKMPGSGTM